MMKAAVIVFTLLLPLLSSPQQTQTQQVWDKEPNSFRDVPFGAAKQTAKETIKNMRCVVNECDSVFILAEGVRAETHWTFQEDKLEQVLMTFPSEHYNFIKEVFVKKYGPPSTVKTQEIQNQYGAKFQDESLYWTGRVISVALNRYASDLTTGGAFIGLKELLEGDPNAVDEAAERME